MKVRRLVLLFMMFLGVVACGGQDTPIDPTSTPVAAAVTAALVATPLCTTSPAPTDTSTPAATPTLVPTLPPASIPTEASEVGALPAHLEREMIQIEWEVEQFRGLDATADITRTIMARQELAEYLIDEFDAEYPPEEVAADVRVMAAFDFVPADFDLRQALLDLYTEQVLGMYDDELDTFFVVTDDDFDLMDRLTLAHEYVHGLQDQHFDLDTFIDDEQMDDDQALARLALVEGDATLAMSEYLMRHMAELTSDDLASLEGGEAAGSQEALAAAPPILRETMIFPYVAGLEFVATIQAGGWAAVDAVYLAPPVSTEQILHPEKYLAGDEPEVMSLPPLTDTLGSGWTLVDADSLGEFQTQLYLAGFVDDQTATMAAGGWDGDRYAVYARGDEDVLLFVTAWDSEQDVQEFVAAYQLYAEAKYRAGRTRETGSTLWWETPGEVTALAWAGSRVVLVVGPGVELVERVLAEVEL
ncbi:MAG: hypothetical protein JXA93_07195 [Anaerolineae bacterium]|nr:hypothetical protein [Anaerolineae bacterium]